MIIQLNSNKLENEFIYSYLPKFIKNISIAYVKNSLNQPILNFIKQTYKVDIIDFMNQLDKYIKIYNIDFNYTFDLDRYSLYKNISYAMLFSLLDKGNLDNKGLNIVQYIKLFVTKNLNNIYLNYQAQEN